LSVRELARRWAVAPRKVRSMVARGLLRAIDVGTGRKQLRFVPEAVTEAEGRLAVVVAKPRRQRRDSSIDPGVLAMLEGAAS
jgi:hypothetical protein